MPDTPTTPSDRPLTATQREVEKSPRRKREDVAYTINHTIVCGTKDMLEPFFTNWIQKTFGSRLPDKDPSLHSNLRSWFIGEAAGDVGAVPVTIAFQRLAPEFMASVGGKLEGAFGSHFRKGARHAAREWALERGISPDDPRLKEREERYYRYEMDHLPQAAIWTVSSIGMNVGTQKILPVLTKGELGNEAKIGELLLFKSIGAAVAAGALFAARSTSPRLAHKWDRWMAEHVFTPAEEAVSGLLGIKTPKEESGPWENRMASEDKSASRQTSL